MERQAWIDKMNEVSKLSGFSIKEHDRVHPYSPEEHYTTMYKDTQVLHFATGQYHIKDRLAVTVSYQRDMFDYNNAHSKAYYSITCALTKTSEQIINDVNRRLLPVYLKALEKVIATNASIKLAYEKRKEATDTIAHFLNTTSTTDKQAGKIYAYGCGVQGLSVIDISYHGDVVMKLTLNTEHALEVLKLVKSFKEGN